MTRVLTLENLRGILGDQPAKPQPILQGAYTNYTPVMLGDYRARHFRCRDRNCKTIEASPGHAAQAIRGKARWLARVALASLKGCNRDYTRIERECGAVELQGVGRVGLVELMFGSITGAQLASPFTLKARMLLDGRGYDSLAKGYAETSDKELPIRIRVLTMGKNRLEKKLIDALKEDTVKLELEVGLAPHWLKLRERARGRDADHLDDLPCFYAALVAVTPLLLGLGKATTRGFGRFKPVSLETPLTAGAHGALEGYAACSGDARELLVKVTGNLNLASRVREAQRAEEALVGMLDAIVGLAELVTGVERGDDSWGLVPRLSIVLSKLRVVEVPCVADHRSFDSAIKDAIGAAALKQTWKADASKSGLPFHTWPLGMPRKSYIRCKCYEYENPDVIPKHRRELYGYIVVDDSIYRRYHLSDNICIESELCVGGRSSRVRQLGDEKVVLRYGDISVEIAAKDVRHQSMIVMFPLPSSAKLIAVLPFLSHGLNLSIDIESVSADLDESELQLFRRLLGSLHLLHLGGHGSNRDAPSPCCNIHLVNVASAIRQKKVDAPNGPEVCGCGSDDAGVCVPPGRDKEDCVECKVDCYRRAVEAAYEWVIYSLGRCGQRRRPSGRGRRGPAGSREPMSGRGRRRWG